MIPRRMAGGGGSALAGAPANTPSLVAPGQTLPVAAPVAPEPDFADGPAVMLPDAPAMTEPPRPQIAGTPTPQQQATTPSALLTQLQQLTTAVRDSQIANVVARDTLVKRGMAAQYGGFNILTVKGLTYLIDFGLL